MYSVVNVRVFHLRRVTYGRFRAAALSRCSTLRTANFFTIGESCRAENRVSAREKGNGLLNERDIENTNQKVCVNICEWPNHTSMPAILTWLHGNGKCLSLIHI